MMTLNEKTEVINRIASMPRDSVTLDGKPALICGLACEFLTVVTMTTPRTQAEFSWSTVSRIIAKDGAFKS